MKKLLLAIALTLGAVTPAAAQPASDGWFQFTDGVFGRWCVDCVDRNLVTLKTYQGLELWCRDVVCGETYVTVSFLDSQGRVMTQAIDRKMLSQKGDRAVFLFQTSGNPTRFRFENLEGW
jgi:hypothetical protein